jgi:MFS family permease
MGDTPRPFGGLLRRHRDFRLLWVGATVGKLGDSITGIAMPLVAVSTLNASTFEVGLLEAVGWLAWVLIGLPVGVWVDRWHRRPVMLIASAVSFVLFVSVPVAAWLHLLSIGLLLLVALLAGASTVFFQTSYFAYLPGLLAPGDRPEGNAKLEGSSSAAQLVGQGAGGLIAQVFGAVDGMLADAISFLVSLVCIGAVGYREPAPEPSARDSSMWPQIRTGIALVLGDRWIRPLCFFGGASNLALTGFSAIQIVFLVRTVGLSAGSVGGLIAAGSLGGIAGAFLARRVANRIGTARSTVVFAAGVASFALLMPLTFGGPGVTLFVAGEFLVVTGIAASNVNLAVFGQQYCPPQLLGRMIAGTSFITYGTIPLGALLGGALGGALGPRTGMWIMTALVPVAGLVLLFSPIGRTRDFPTTQLGHRDEAEAEAPEPA